MRIGIEYSKDQINSALGNDPSIVGLMIKKRQSSGVVLQPLRGTIQSHPFEVKGVKLIEQLGLPDKKYSFDEVDVSLTDGSEKFWTHDETTTGAVGSTRKLNTYTGRAVLDIDASNVEFYKPEFGFAIFFRSELQVMLSYSEGLVFSGATINLGVLAFPTKIDNASAEDIFTFKAEAIENKTIDIDTILGAIPTGNPGVANPNLTPSPNTNSEPVGAIPLVTTGLPCPPTWKQAASAEFIRTITDIKFASHFPHGDLSEKDFLRTLQNAWIEFAVRTIEPEPVTKSKAVKLKA